MQRWDTQNRDAFSAHDVCIDPAVCHGQRYNRERWRLSIKEKHRGWSGCCRKRLRNLKFFEHLPNIRNKIDPLWRGAWLCEARTAVHNFPAGKRSESIPQTKRNTDAPLYSGWTDHGRDFLMADVAEADRRTAAPGTILTVSGGVEHQLDMVKVADHIIDLGQGRRRQPCMQGRRSR